MGTQTLKQTFPSIGRSESRREQSAEVRWETFIGGREPQKHNRPQKNQTGGDNKTRNGKRGSYERKNEKGRAIKFSKDGSGKRMGVSWYRTESRPPEKKTKETLIGGG